MKKLITIILILALLLPAAAFAAYSPALGMDMKTFVQKYNAVQAPLNAPIALLETMDDWKYDNGSWLAWYYGDKDKRINIALESKDPLAGKDLAGGLDTIVIMADEQDLIALIDIAMRCTDPFTDDILTVDTSTYFVGDVLRFFYENNAKQTGFTSYRPLTADGKIILSMFYIDGSYFFRISSDEVIK